MQSEGIAEKSGDSGSAVSAWVVMLGSCLGAGMFPRLRGTIATAIFAATAFGVEQWLALPWWWALVAAAAVTAVGWWLAGLVVARGQKDPAWFVMDELAGVLATVAGIGVLSGAKPLVVAAAAFVFFRLMDAWKPGPIARIEQIGGAAGVMLDDLAAAVAAWPLTLGAAMLAVELWPELARA